MKLSLSQQSFLNALGTVAYVAIVAYFLFNSKTIFGEVEDSFLIPMFMMLLLILSATVTGFLVIGKPLQLYLSDQKSQALKLLGRTLAWVAIFAIVIAIMMLKMA